MRDFYAMLRKAMSEQNSLSKAAKEMRKPSTLAQQVATAQAETATWPPGMLERVLPRRK